MSSRGNLDHSGLRWSLGKIAYQFIGSGPYLYLDVADSLNPSGYLPRGFGACVEVKGTEFVVNPLYSNLEEDTENPKRWEFFYSWYRLVDNQFQLRVKPGHQPDGQGVNQWFSLTKDWLLTTWAQSHPCNGIGSQGFYEATYTVDTGYDYPPVYFKGTTGSFYQIPANWWRSGCTQIVDGQTYLIFVDVDSLFYAVSLSNITNKKTVSAPWPSGFTIATLGRDSGQTDEEYLRSINPAWKFNHAGTRAACIVAQRQPAWLDGSYTSSLYDGAGTYRWDLQHDTPLMVEVELIITSLEYNDFVFNVNLRQTIDSLEQDFVPVAVDYTLMVDGITDDSLSLLVFEHYLNPIEMVSFNTTYEHNYAYHPNKATLGIIKTQSPTGFTFTTQRTFLAYYLSWENSFNGTREFIPQLLDYPEIDDELIKSVDRSSLCFIAQIHSIELSSLSLALCVTAWNEFVYHFYLDKPNDVTQVRSSYSEAYCTQVVTFNEIQLTLTQLGGHPTLSIVLYDMLNRISNSYPHLDDYSLFPIASTISYRTQSGSEYGAVDVVVDTGSEIVTPTVVGCEHIAKQSGGGGFTNITYCPLFSGNSFVAIPQHHLFFDSVPSVRPGMTTNLANPGLFEDYPAGVVHHENLHALIMGANRQVKGRIRTHPSGSYSLWFGPIAANKRLITYSGGTSDLQNDYDQTIIDHLYFKYKDNELNTNHLAIMNASFDKNWSYDDYCFTLIKSVGKMYVAPQSSTYPPATAYYLRESTPLWDYPLGVSHAAFYLQLLNNDSNVGYYTIQSAFSALHSYFSDETPMPAQEAIFHFGRTYRVE